MVTIQSLKIFLALFILYAMMVADFKWRRTVAVIACFGPDEMTVQDPAYSAMWTVGRLLAKNGDTVIATSANQPSLRGSDDTELVKSSLAISSNPNARLKFCEVMDLLLRSDGVIFSEKPDVESIGFFMALIAFNARTDDAHRIRVAMLDSGLGKNDYKALWHGHLLVKMDHWGCFPNELYKDVYCAVESPEEAVEHVCGVTA